MQKELGLCVKRTMAGASPRFYSAWLQGGSMVGVEDKGHM